MSATEPPRHHSCDESPAWIDLLADPALTDDDAAQVFDYLLGRAARRRLLDGSRSVILPSRGSGVLERLADEALAEPRSGRTKPLDSDS